MIKINLLLARKEKRKVGIRKELMSLIGSMIALLIILVIVHWIVDSQKEGLTLKISQKNEEIAHYKSLITKANKYKEEQKILQEKLDIINSKRKMIPPAKLLDELGIQKPEKLHLESLKKEGSKVGIEGIALDDETVANFMTNLRKSKLFKSVDLVVSEQSEQSKVKLKKFTLSCEIISS